MLDDTGTIYDGNRGGSMMCGSSLGFRSCSTTIVDCGGWSGSVNDDDDDDNDVGCAIRQDKYL